MLQGPMGLWCSGGCQKLYGLVRKPVAALHNAAAEPLRHASNYEREKEGGKENEKEKETEEGTEKEKQREEKI